MREHTSGVGHQHAEQAVLNRREMHLDARTAHQPGRAVNFHLAKTEHRVGVFMRCGARTPQVGAHPGQQLSNAKRLGQIVVSSGIQRGNFVGLVAARRQHDDGHRRPAAHIADDVQSVAVRQAQVQHQQVGFAGTRLGQAFFSGVRLVHQPAFGFQGSAHKAANLRFIFNDNNGRTGHG